MYLTKRQRQIADFIGGFISRRGYAPSIAEIGKRFGLSSVATVHAHLRNLERKGAISRRPRRSRSIELLPAERIRLDAVELPLLGLIAAGEPIEALAVPETMAVPKEFAGGENAFALRVRGDSMIEEGIRDGDYVVVERRAVARNGETVVALIRGEEATLKMFRQEGTLVTLVPANPAVEPITVRADEVAIQGVVVAVFRKYR
ncbi:MAG: transcriptional repressor LexA [Candidatus Aureabacteria bacterium]|nr:transcriptional repressor LexA [Candidatus Auribacterota bacterium]NLW93678.1 transcriptional repressor LexA [Chlamydiota bacterium]HOE26297.1 transcriptional repressor LexA [bacterium]HQM52119.1 transcriptional repressor LexA [bacterium]